MIDADVPCNGCTACCQREMVTLEPEDGNHRRYRTVVARHPLTGESVRRLEMKPDGSCTYLGDKVCTIYDRRPVMCRVFDCRGMVKMLGVLEALKMAVNDPVIRAGISRIVIPDPVA